MRINVIILFFFFVACGHQKPATNSGGPKSSIPEKNIVVNVLDLPADVAKTKKHTDSLFANSYAIQRKKIEAPLDSINIAINSKKPFQEAYSSCPSLKDSNTKLNNRSGKIRYGLREVQDTLEYIIEKLIDLNAAIEINIDKGYAIAKNKDSVEILLSSYDQERNDIEQQQRTLIAAYDKGIEVFNDLTKQQEDLRKKIKVLESNFEFYRMSYTRHTIFFNSGKWDRSNMNLGDSSSIKKYLNGIIEYLEMIKKKPDYRGLTLKIVVIASGHIDEQPAGEETIRGFPISIQDTLPSDRNLRLGYADRILSELRAETLAKYVQSILDSKNITGVEVCAKGLGLQQPIMGLPSSGSKNDQSRRVAVFFCQVVAW